MRHLLCGLFVVVGMTIGAAIAEAQDLSSNIMRRVNSANGDLDRAAELIERGDPKNAELQIARASQEFKNIGAYYGGTYDENHPTLVALEKRIEELSAKAKAGTSSAGASQPAQAAQTTSNRRGDPPLVIEFKREIRAFNEIAGGGGTFDGSDASYESAKRHLEAAQAAYDKLKAEGGAPDPTMYTMDSQLKLGTSMLGQIYAKTPAAKAAAQAAEDDKNEKKRQQIMARFNDQGMTSNLHQKNAGRVVFAKKMIGFKAQDSAKLEDTFSLSDPIFGRVLLERSLGNTPIYADGFAEPQAMREFDYDVRLYINGKNVPVAFGVFQQGGLEGEAGQQWTTFQFAPHPVGMENDFKRDAEPWRKATAGLAEGAYDVRFEFFATNGQFRSAAPIAVGAFTLKVGAGERIAATGKFPATSYAGGDAGEIAAAMRKALVGPVAKSADEIRDVSVTSEWNPLVYSDTKRRYRAISGAVLWADSNGDGVCRYTTYNFVSDATGPQSWGPLRFRSFCNGCEEGNAECPN